MADSLLTDLVSWWPLEEPHSARADAHGTNHLSDVNIVGSAAGRVGNAASFVSASQKYLTRSTTDASLQFGDEDFTLAVWVNLANVTSSQLIAGRGTLGGDTTDEYVLWVGAGAARFYVGNLVAVSGKASRPITAGAWQLLIGWHDATANTVNLQVNNGAVGSGSYAGGSAPGTHRFRIGATDAPGVYANGLIDEVAIWSRVLTSGERTRLYNAGAGLTYSDLTQPTTSARRILSSPYLIGAL